MTAGLSNQLTIGFGIVGVSSFNDFAEGRNAFVYKTQLGAIGNLSRRTGVFGFYVGSEYLFALFVDIGYYGAYSARKPL